MTKHRIFYLGTLISSVGSMTLTVCLVSMLKLEGQSLTTIGILIAAMRIAPIIVSTLFGSKLDQFSPRVLVALTEAIGGIGSVAALFCWVNKETPFVLFGGFLVFRSAAQAISSGVSAKISKGLTEIDGKGLEHAIFLNIATAGATLFAGLSGWYAVLHYSLTHILIFDAVTFAINGIAILMIVPNLLVGKPPPRTKMSLLSPYRALYRRTARVVVMDLLLAASMAGLAASSARLADGREEIIPAMMAIFGLSFWISGFFLKKGGSRIPEAVPWLTLACGFALLPWVAGLGVVPLMATCFVRDFSYATLFTRHLAETQARVPYEESASVSIARGNQIVLALALGEGVLGAASSLTSLFAEFTLRTFLALSGVVASFILSAGITNKRPLSHG